LIDAKREIVSCWDLSSAAYDEHHGHGIKSAAEAEAWRDALRRIVGASPLTILDIGTGTGFLAILLAELGHCVKGVDLSEGMMSKAKKKAAEKNFPITFELADAENLSTEQDGYYDVVINRHLLWTLLTPEKALAEWHRVLKPGGRVVIIDGNWSDPSIGEKIRANLGKLLIAVTEFKNPWRKSGSYSKALTAMLPMQKKENSRNALSIIEQAGFTDVSKQYLGNIDQIERRAMPFKLKLTMTYKRYVITAAKR
jgi:ubiquinone/menaquinone biosynthesis C-methylase UbiE